MLRRVFVFALFALCVVCAVSVRGDRCQLESAGGEVKYGTCVLDIYQRRDCDEFGSQGWAIWADDACKAAGKRTCCELLKKTAATAAPAAPVPPQPAKPFSAPPPRPAAPVQPAAPQPPVPQPAKPFSAPPPRPAAPVQPAAPQPPQPAKPFSAPPPRPAAPVQPAAPQPPQPANPFAAAPARPGAPAGIKCQFFAKWDDAMPYHGTCVASRAQCSGLIGETGSTSDYPLTCGKLNRGGDAENAVCCAPKGSQPAPMAPPPTAEEIKAAEAAGKATACPLPSYSFLQSDEQFTHMLDLSLAEIEDINMSLLESESDSTRPGTASGMAPAAPAATRKAKGKTNKSAAAGGADAALKLTPAQKKYCEMQRRKWLMAKARKGDKKAQQTLAQFGKKARNANKAAANKPTAKTAFKNGKRVAKAKKN